MKIAYLGTGCWGFCLASLLASKGHSVTCWTMQADLARRLTEEREHPFLPHYPAPAHMHFTTDLAEALDGAEMIVESVTSSGLRSVFESVKRIGIPACPLVVTSKGIEQNTGLILPEVIVDVLGENVRPQVGCVSGPSFAQEVIRGLPTSVVGSAFDYTAMMHICDVFTTPTFRVYPNADILGVGFGGALKNVIAVACGISDGLKLGNSSKAALMTRGLHEVKKLAIACGCKGETLNGLSGMGDFVLTCNSIMSRNFRYGFLMAEGMTPREAQDHIEMVVEGVYACLSALQLAKDLDIPMPITETVYEIINENMTPIDAVRQLMQRTIKEEHL